MEKLEDVLKKYNIAADDIGVVQGNYVNELLNQDIYNISAKLLKGIEHERWKKLMAPRVSQDYNVPKEIKIDGIAIKINETDDNFTMVVLRDYWCDTYELVRRNNRISERVVDYIRKANSNRLQNCESL